MAEADDLSRNLEPSWQADRVDRGQMQIAPAQTPGTEGLLRLAIGVVIIAGLYFAQQVLIPITLAVLLSFVLSPVVAFLRKAHFPKGLAVILSVLFALGVVGSAGTIVGTQMASLSNDMPRYVQTLHSKIQSAEHLAISRLSAISGQLTAASTDSGNRPAAAQNSSTPAAPTESAAPTSQPSNALSTAFGILEPILAPFETFIIVLVVAIFMLLQRDEVRDKTIRLMGSSDLFRTTKALEDAGQRLSRYLLSQLAVNTGFGVVIGVGTWLIGLPVPLVWGVLAGMLRFVPYIGAMLGAILPMIVAAAIDPGWTTFMYVALLFVIVEPLTGYALEPLLYGHSTGLSPLSVIIAAVFWTWIWGPIGLVLSMPLTLCLVVLGQHIPQLQFLAVLLGDQPVLSPVESLYQRMLAGELDEMVEQAETCVEETSLTQYYDDVLLPALRLAAADIRRDALSSTQAEQLCAQVIDFTEDVYEDIGAGGDAAAADTVVRQPYVACISGRGTLDPAAAAMAVQLLAQMGVAAQTFPNTVISRQGIGDLDLTGARSVLIVVVNPPAGPARLRLKIHRLRQHTDLPIVVGFLQPEQRLSLEAGDVESVEFASGFKDAVARAAAADAARVTNGATASAAG